MKTLCAYCLAISLLILAGCSSTPTRDMPVNGVHVVQKGEFISLIAQNYGLEWEELARINGIKPPYTLHIGQRLRLTSGASLSASAPNVSSASSASSVSSVSSGSEPMVTEVDAGEPIGNVRWVWPTEGRVVTTFKANDATRKGIDIAGTAGQKILAAADGEVLYSGAGLAGYGKLIIIKHDARFLSAYAYNEKLLVSEGKKVKSGQVIAQMGLESVGKPRLHFEIRFDGQPINPLRQLPQQK